MRLIYVEKESGPYQLTRDLSWDEYVALMGSHSGQLNGEFICAIEVWYQPPPRDPQKVRVMLFDFAMKRAGTPLIQCYRYAGAAADALRQVR